MRSLLQFRDVKTGRRGDRLRAVVSAPTLDHDTLATHLLFDAPLPYERTLYTGVVSEPSPEAWGPGSSAASEPPSSPAAAAELLVAALERSIERAVGGARRVAVLAGGGIDSSGLLALTVDVMRRRGGSAFAVALDFESPGDDRPHLRALQAHLSCEVVRVSPRAGAAHLSLLHEGIDGAPVFWPFTVVQTALYAAAREHGAEILLTGAGGDHLFDGDPRALAALARKSPREAVRAARSLRDFDELRFPALEWVLRPLVVPLVPTSLRRVVARRIRRRSPSASEAWAGSRLRDVAHRLADRKLEHALARPSADVERYFEHPERRHFLWTVHQEQVAGGIERRDPYFTLDVARVMANVPAPFVLDGGRRRGLFRRAMRGKVPESILDRPDKAEFAPAFTMFFEAAGGTQAFARELEGRALGRLGLVDPGAFAREAPRALTCPDALARFGYAWAAISTEAFLSSHPELV